MLERDPIWVAVAALLEAAAIPQAVKTQVGAVALRSLTDAIAAPTALAKSPEPKAKAAAPKPAAAQSRAGKTPLTDTDRADFDRAVAICGTKARLAERLGISRQTLVDVQNGKSQRTAQVTLDRLAEILSEDRQPELPEQGPQDAPLERAANYELARAARSRLIGQGAPFDAAHLADAAGLSHADAAEFAAGRPVSMAVEDVVLAWLTE